MTTEEKILSKVRKMLAIANNDAASDEERDTALKIAHDLLTKYELDMSDVDQSIRDEEDPRGQFTADGWGAPWAKTVRNAMGKLFRCYYYNGRKINGTRSEYHFVGRESAATTAMYMSDWIVKSVLREADRRYGHRLNPEGRSFCIGVSHRLWKRVEEMTAAKQQEISSAGFALILYDLAKREEEANLALIKGSGTELKQHKHRVQNVRLLAYGAGQTHADTINLNTQLSGKEQGKLK